MVSSALPLALSAPRRPRWTSPRAPLLPTMTQSAPSSLHPQPRTKVRTSACPWHLKARALEEPPPLPSYRQCHHAAATPPSSYCHHRQAAVTATAASAIATRCRHPPLPPPPPRCCRHTVAAAVLPTPPRCRRQECCVLEYITIMAASA